ncbi:MAG: tetratricopeptide repeat protein [bacterium]
MKAQQDKEFSVVIRLSEFASLNGQLSNFEREDQRQEFVKHFFLNKYGHGGGKLRVAQKQSKVKLTWIQPRFDENAEGAHERALAAARLKDYKEAIQNWVKAISLNPADPDYYFNLGIAFFELKNFIEAIENFNKALDLCPIYYKAHLILGTVYLKIRKFQKAEKYLQESLIFYPNHPLAYLNLGAVYSILKRYDDGIRMFLRSIELSSNEVRAHFGLAKIYSLRGEVDKANRYFKNVIDIGRNHQLTNHAKRAMISTPMAGNIELSNIDTKNIEKYYQEGYNAFLFSDYEKAVQMYTIYLRQKPDDDFVWYSLGEASLRAGYLQKAAEAFEKAIAINRSKGLYYKELALTFVYLDDTERTIKCLEQATKLGKVDSVSNTIWGKALIQQGNYDDALRKLEEAVRLNPTNLFAKYNLAIAAMKNNEVDAAISHLQEIIRTPINSPIKMEAENLIART